MEKENSQRKETLEEEITRLKEENAKLRKELAETVNLLQKNAGLPPTNFESE